MESNKFGDLRREVKIHKEALATEANYDWGIFDEPAEDYEYSFDFVMGERNFQKYFEKYYSEKKENMVGIELGGPGNSLFKDLQPWFRKTLGLYKSESESKRTSLAPKNHFPKKGDIFSRQGLKQVDIWLEGEKADFIIERMEGGWKVNGDAFILFEKYLKLWYERLDSGGLMLMQTPFISKDTDKKEKFNNRYGEGAFTSWISYIKRNYEGVLDINFTEQAILIRKLENAPDKLELGNE